MDIRIYLYLAVLLFGILFSLFKNNRNSKSTRKCYIITILSLFILESSLRHLSVGPDTYGYFSKFANTEFTSWSDIFKSFGDTYLRGEGKDPGYYLYVKAFQIFSNDFNIFLFFNACFFFIPLGIILYRYSNHIFQLAFAFVLYISLFRIIALSGIRQQIAMGFSFIAFLYFQNKEYKKYFISIFLGSFIHISLLLFLLLYLVNVFVDKKIKILHWLTFLSVPLVIIFANIIVLFMASFIKNDYYSGYGLKEMSGGAQTYVGLILLISFSCLLFLKKDFFNNNYNNKVFYSNLPLLTFFSPLIMLDGSMIRMGQYFTIYLMLLIPFLFDYITKKGSLRIYLYSFSIVLLILLSLSTPTKYYFFWEYVSFYNI